jgi:hypothetical protein
MSFQKKQKMIINPPEKIEVEITPEKIRMPMYCLKQNGYIPLTFFTNLGVSFEDIKKYTGIDNYQQGNLLKVQINELDIVPVISYQLATGLIIKLSENPQYHIFKNIRTGLISKSIESGAITIQEFGEDLRKDSVFWQSKINNLNLKCSEPVVIKPHPSVDFEAVRKLEEEENDENILDFNPIYVSFISYRLINFLGNSCEPLTDDIWHKYLFKCLNFHHRALEYEYFKYHLLIKDESICLLTQTLLTDWMVEGGFCFNYLSF